MEPIVLDKILIVRNDSTTNWETSTYVLQKGEFGIGYIGPLDKQRAIVKIGNGIDFWINLPIIDYTLPEDFILTEDFGKYKIENGSINTGGAGMLLSEWLKEALYQVRTPEITQPSIISEVKPVFEKVEIGSRIEAIQWEGTYTEATYEFGSTNSKDTIVQTNPLFAVSYKGEVLGDTISGEARVVQNTFVDEIGEKQYDEIVYRCAWADAEFPPVNNIGEAIPERLVRHDEVTYYHPAVVTGYREGCFYGPVRLSNFNEDKITNKVIRELPYRLGKEYSAEKDLECIIPSGTTAFLIAVPTGSTGPSSVINKSVGAEMWGKDLFQKKTILVGGADSTNSNSGKYAVQYDVYYYKPAYPYQNTVYLSIRLSE